MLIKFIRAFDYRAPGGLIIAYHEGELEVDEACALKAIAAGAANSLEEPLEDEDGLESA